MLNVVSKQYLKVIVGKKRQPMGMNPIQHTTSGEVDQILVVDQHMHTVLHPSQIELPFVEGRDDNCRLLVVDPIIDFRGCKLHGVKCHQMQCAIVVWLGQDNSNGSVRDVGFNLEGSRWVEGTNTGAERKVGFMASKELRVFHHDIIHRKCLNEAW